jgi:hypothetical protein
MNETASAASAVSVRRPPPSTYLWTADGWIRPLRRPAAPERPAPETVTDERMTLAAG